MDTMLLLPRRFPGSMLMIVGTRYPPSEVYGDAVDLQSESHRRMTTNSKMPLQ
jgi:hypothetical protein